MMGSAFFDSNILVYTDDASAPEKQKGATELVTSYWRRGLSVISLQVIQEYFAAATRKLRVDPEIAQRKVEIFARGNVVRFETDDVVRGIELHRLLRISFWDALTVHAARLPGAAVLYSADLQHGATIAGVRIVNPFI
jgi:predicted nucleic acid-binding protein